MEQAPRLLLVDDDPVLCGVVADYLRERGFAVVIESDGAAALLQVSMGACDLVLIGDMLPGLSGIEVLRRIRQLGELPVVMLNAKNDDIERIIGIELGADDYLSKSCNLRELTARLHAILRRARHAVAIEKLQKSGLGSLGLFPAERKAAWRGKPLQLTSTEFDLLQHLFQNAGHAIGKAELAMTVLGRTLETYERSLDMHISNLRKKLGKLADGRSPIQTVRGTGYQLLKK